MAIDNTCYAGREAILVKRGVKQLTNKKIFLPINRDCNLYNSLFSILNLKKHLCIQEKKYMLQINFIRENAEVVKAG